MAITLLSGLHLTALDRRAIATAIANQWASAVTPRVQYRVACISPGFYAVQIAKDGRTHSLIVANDDKGALAPWHEARAMRDAWDSEAKAASQALNAIAGVGSGPMGLTPDAIKFSPEYQRARSTYERAAAKLRHLNGWIMRHYRKEARAESVARREGRA